MTLCEIRVTTYKRPQLLQRALMSAIAQIHQDWIALVFDDSPEQEAKEVVECLNDSRIIYQPHQTNLGQAKNLDHAFKSSDYAGGKYAFVLEDDNYLFPEFIAKNIEAIEAKNVNIVLRNQEIRHERYGASISFNETTRGRWFKQGIYKPIEIHARLLFCEGISNGGLFWRTDRIKSNLQIGSSIEDALHQELFRTLQIQEPLVFEPYPLCVYTFFPRRKGNDFWGTLQLKLNQIQYNRGLQSILIHLIRRHGSSVVEIAQEISLEAKAEILLEQQLLQVFYLNHKFSQLGRLKAYNILLRHLIRYSLLKDPFKRILVADL